ncbi:hypothetical protein LTR37_001515 [Vermiconidia calcicola]|uniref:Uncharacterized protein n=1 Tax=Vermiconidia calcicola TaxID=1690605 RepID=A0ACC3NWV2_9PEZI|nr:hypothetical protein LTR37_001515 [Vermiconidia calcicola]
MDSDGDEYESPPEMPTPSKSRSKSKPRIGGDGTNVVLATIQSLTTPALLGQRLVCSKAVQMNQMAATEDTRAEALQAMANNVQ